jgi:predicted house-cleaning noncanonical NTP pyrophosphatase (MazG superfamily)
VYYTSSGASIYPGNNDRIRLYGRVYLLAGDVKMNKLVRDHIPQIIKSAGKNPKYHQANDQEFRQLLIVKLNEEVTEFINSNDPEELADILEVIHTLAQELNITYNDIENLRLQKRNQRGGFDKKYILEE